MIAPDPLPLFPASEIPFARPAIPGWPCGQRVMIPDPRAAALERPGRVVVTLPHFNRLVIRTDDERLVDIEPERVRKI